MTDTQQAAPVEPSWDSASGLGIKERRSFSTLQVLGAVVVFVIFGVVLGHCGARSRANAERKSLYDLGAASSSPATTTAQPGAGEQVTSTTVAASPPSTAAAATASGPAVVLMPNANGSGPKTLPAFSAGAPWKIGWAFRCVLAPGGSGAFQVFAVPEGGAVPSAPAVDQSGRQSQGVADQSGAGRQHLEIRTDPACAWAVKVTGPAG